MLALLSRTPALLSLVAVVAMYAIACGASGAPLPVEAPASTPVPTLVLLTSRVSLDGKVTADWMGADPGAGFDPGTPVGQWVREIWFRFKPDGNPLRYPIPGPLDPEEYTFDIFSPDGRYVALSQGHGEPFHVVPVAALRDYLGGDRTRHEIVTGQRASDDPAAYAEEPRWTANDTFEFTAGCCESYWHVKHRIGKPTEFGPAQHH